MNEQWQRLQRNVGNIFLQTVGKVLPYLNAVLMVLNEIAKVIAGLFGFKLGDFDYFDEMSVGVEEFGDALDSANDSANKLKQGLRGFDKLNVITTPSAGGSTGGGGVGGGVNPQLMDAFNKAFDEYNKKLSGVQMKATKIRDKIMEWLGFTKQVDEETGEVSFKFDHITSGTLLGALAVGGSIYKGINFIFKILKKIGLIKFGSIKELVGLFKDGTIATNLTKFTTGFTNLATALGISAGALATIIGVILAVGAALVYAYNTNEDFKNSVDTMVKNVLTLFQTLLDKAVEIFTLLWELIEPIWNGIKDTIIFAVTTAYDTIVFIFQQIIDSFSGWAKIINDIINGDFDAAMTDLENMVVKLWENWTGYFDKILESFRTWAENIWKDIQEFIPKAIEKFDDIVKWFDELPEKVKEASKNATEWALEEFGKIYEWFSKLPGKIKDVIEHPENHEDFWNKIGSFIVDGIIKGVLLAEIGIIKWVWELPGKIQNAFWQVWGYIKDIGWNIISGILEGMWDFIWSDGLKPIGKGIVNAIKSALGIASPAKLIIDAKIGDFSMEAIAIGMERQLPLIEKEAESIVDSLNKGIQEAGIDTNFSYDLPQFDASSMLFDLQNSSDNKSNTNKTTINPTIIVQVGNKEIAKQVITDLQDMAKDNGKPIMIGG